MDESPESPIAKVLRIADALESRTTAARYTYGRPAFLGLGLGRDGTTTAVGVYPDTPAAAAGLAAGDTVTAVDGTATRTQAALRRALTAHQPGDRISVTWTDTAGTSHISRMTLVPGAVG